MQMSEEEYLAHYGTKRHSGRYPWGSGGDDNSSGTRRSMTLLDHIAEMRKQGLSDTEIAKGLGMSTTEYRAQRSIANNARKASQISQAQRLKDKGYSNVAIGQRMGLNESSVRALLAPGAKDKADVLATVSNALQKRVDEVGFVDVGSGVEQHMGISEAKLASAVAVLKAKGYTVEKVQVPQLGTAPGKKTTVRVLAPPGTTYRDIASNITAIHQIQDFSDDGGHTMLGIKPPLSISSKRVAVNYAEDGGSHADGVMYVRPGVKDVSLGGSSYAQVRVMVDGSHYLKGMAMYKDDLPTGVDIMFNTNKSKADIGHDKLAAFKPLKKDENGNVDMDNPFGASLRRQIQEGGKVTSAMNIVNEEGNWETWSRNLPSQFLSKQSPTLAQRQLDMTYDAQKAKLDDIMSLTNPAVKQKLLESFADGADSAAVTLKAAALPRQASHVILPINSMKETEVYAPNFRNGERVALIRYPHGGTFEIPELTVNNRHPEARKALANTPDAIGINHKVAERLSGADFDGDSVTVIPMHGQNIKTTPALAGLKGFDPQHEYPGYEGMPPMTARQKATQMGLVSNLITDMTIKGAPPSELAQAVRHSMVVIDAEKHNLNWKLSAEQNGISNLMQKYQGRKQGGASTLISRASGRKEIPRQEPRSYKEGGPIDPKTGRLMFTPTGEINSKTGKLLTTTTTKLAAVSNAHELSSGTKIEDVYAEHSNRMRDLANMARKELVATPNIKVSDSAKKTYANEVQSLNAKLALAIRNRPLERQAQIFANAVVKAKTDAHPEIKDDAAQMKRVRSQALIGARIRTGASKSDIQLTESEWHAIQAGAISHSKLRDILNYADLDRVKELATPKTGPLMNTSTIARAKAMLASGHTQAEVAQALGVGLTTLKNGLKG
jgi:hypothetical protein